MISRALLRTVVDQFSLPLAGAHGLSHWARVCENARVLAPLTGAKLEVVELFAILHDAKRRSEMGDRGHGKRAAEFVRSLGQSQLGLCDRDFELLVLACARHEQGLTEGDPTVQTCWDADRLDISRVGFRLDPARLCTDAARTPEILDAAVLRSVQRSVPDWVANEWGIGDLGGGQFGQHEPQP
jgi:uncharacterized protein